MQSVSKKEEIGRYIYAYKVVISVCLFVCPLITDNQLADLPQIFNEKFGRTTEMFLTWFFVK